MNETMADQSKTEHFQTPLGFLNGKAILDLPQDLYIPPDALRIFLEAFEGPLDLLLYLIKRQNLDILNIPIAQITHQYIEYIELMQELQLELAAEYLLMAAMLAEIKSRMLLPRVATEDEQSDDPRAELVRRLQEYERFKEAAENLDTLPRRDRDTFQATAHFEMPKENKKLPDVQLKELLWALKEVMRQAELRAHHHIEKETLSLRERMTNILSMLDQSHEFISFERFFSLEEGKAGVVVTFIAILELLKGSMIEIVQTEIFGPIHIRGLR